MFNDNDFGADMLDLRDLLEREETILDATDAPDDVEWEFVKQMKELKAEIYGDVADHAENEPTLIRDTYKAEYAEDYASQVTSIDTTSWPLNCIDWDEAADDLFGYDWSEYTVGDYTYLGRA